MKLAPQTVIHNYRILSLIGEGGMGEVYLAEETLLGRQVAIKVLSSAATHDPQFRQRFVNEARMQAGLQHPNIVGLYTFFEQEEVYYMAMEYAEGITLSEMIGITGPIPEDRATRIIRQVLAALDYAHQRGVIHRDIKPGNIMVGANDSVKIMDFGIARMMNAGHMTQTGTRMGTPFYMSPEQVLNPREVDHRTDIYSAGIVFFEMLTGKLPFQTDSESSFILEKQIVDNAIPDPRTFYPYISDKTVNIVRLMTKGDRDIRADMDELTGMFGGTAAGAENRTRQYASPPAAKPNAEPATSEPAHKPFTVPQKPPASPGKVVALILMFVAVVVLVIFALSLSRGTPGDDADSLMVAPVPAWDSRDYEPAIADTTVRAPASIPYSDSLMIYPAEPDSASF